LWRDIDALRLVKQKHNIFVSASLFSRKSHRAQSGKRRRQSWAGERSGMRRWRRVARWRQRKAGGRRRQRPDGGEEKRRIIGGERRRVLKIFWAAGHRRSNRR